MTTASLTVSFVYCEWFGDLGTRQLLG